MFPFLFTPSKCFANVLKLAEFAASSDRSQAYLELAAFFAQTIQETGGKTISLCVWAIVRLVVSINMFIDL